MIYQPAEDSFLIQKYVSQFANGKVLDMGTGSGILAKSAMKNTKDVLAVDVNEEVVKLVSGQGIKTVKSNLFDNIQDKFDVIIFNPPYLPTSKYKDPALDGGGKGYEVIERFLRKAGDYLRDEGIILMLYSSFTKPRKVKQIIRKSGFEVEILEEKKLPFEKLYVVRLSKKEIFIYISSNTFVKR